MAKIDVRARWSYKSIYGVARLHRPTTHPTHVQRPSTNKRQPCKCRTHVPTNSEKNGQWRHRNHLAAARTIRGGLTPTKGVSRHLIDRRSQPGDHDGSNTTTSKTADPRCVSLGYHAYTNDHVRHRKNAQYGTASNCTSSKRDGWAQGQHTTPVQRTG